MNKMRSRGGLAGTAVAVLVLASGAAHAEIEVGTEAGLGYTDNIARGDAAKNDEEIGTIRLDLAWHERTRRLQGDATIDASYFEYLGNTFDSEVVGIADGTITLGLLPERFTWMVRDSYGQTASDPFTPLTPESREDLNYFTTGPDLTLRLGGAGALRLFGRYSITDYEETPIDANRVTAGAAIGRSLSARSEISLNAVSEQLDFDDPANSDFDNEAAFLRYTLDASRTDIETELGYSWVVPDGGERTGGLLMLVRAIRDVSESSTVELELSREFTDASEALRSAIGGGAVGGPDVTATSDPFENRAASLEWIFMRNRTRLSLGAAWSEDLYETQTQFDRTRMSYQAMLARQMAAALELSFGASFDQEDYDNTDLRMDEMALSARLAWRAGRRIVVALSIERWDRNTSDGVNEYVENRAFLTVGYRPLGDVGT